MRKILLLTSIFIISFIATKIKAQINFGGTPVSFLKQSNLEDKLPSTILPKVNVDLLLKEDALEEQNKRISYRFGKDIDVFYTLENSGKWEILPNGDKLWRLKVKSDKAYSLNFIFRKFKLAGNSKLFIYSPDRKDLLGAFTEKNNREDLVFSTTLIRGDEAIFELFEPLEDEGKNILELNKIIHGYKDLLKELKDFGNSGLCNININCPEGLTWQNQKRAVAMILHNGNTRICTGTLINNLKEDATPYFLTADHCTDGEMVSEWVFMFNYESPDCETKNGPLNFTLNGSTLRAKDYVSDFALLELSSNPPKSYNVYYSGWDASDLPGDSCVVIHHPRGDIKKISFTKNTVVSTSGEYEVPDAFWTIDKYNWGTTEGGSSGSALFNKKRLIIGQLNGGTASCVSLTEDNFGKFSYSWDKGLTSAQRLKDWLDPENTGIRILKGRDFDNPEKNNDLAVLSIENFDVNSFVCNKNGATVIVQNKGRDSIKSFTLSYKIDNNQPININKTVNLDYEDAINIDFDNLNMNFGLHTLTVYTGNPNNKEDENKSNDTLSFNFQYVRGNSIKVVFKSDFYPYENSWKITDKFNKIIHSEQSFLGDTLNITELCLKEDCYFLEITDNGEDGVCGLAGERKGYLEVYENGQLLSRIDGCSFDGTKKIDFCVKANINDIKSFIQHIYPNPATNFIRIDYNETKGDYTFFNLLGEKLKSGKLQKGTNRIDLSFTPGIYFIQINSNGINFTEKIVIH